MPQTLQVRTFALGPFLTNCYVVHMGEGSPCMIIDCGFDPDEMFRFINDQKLEVNGLVLTHAHIDHIAGLDAFRRQWPDVRIAIHEAEADYLQDPENNLSEPFGAPYKAPEADVQLKHGDNLALEGMSFELRHTPGHSPGGLTLYQPQTQCAIVGDTLFAQGIGRHDFPHSDHDTLMQSIREQLLSLPDETTVLPGHGPATTIGRERQVNPYLREAAQKS